MALMAILMVTACSDKDEMSKTEQMLKALAGNWLYTSEEDMQCYLITFYESGEFLYQSQEVDVKKTFTGHLAFNEDTNSITLQPNTSDAAITFILGNVDTTGLQLVNSGGKAMTFDKTSIIQLPTHDDWKPWEPLNVNDKQYLEETAKEFMGIFQSNDFKNLTDIARAAKDYETDELYQWQQECIESMIMLVGEKWEEPEVYINDERSWGSNYDFSIRDYSNYFVDYRRLLRAAAFKGHFSVRGGKWVYTQANDLQFTFADRQGNQCILKLTTSGATKTVYAGDHSGYDYNSSEYWYDDYGNKHYDVLYTYFTTHSYLEIPEQISLSLTQNGQTLISTMADFDLSGLNGEQWDMAKNSLSALVKAHVNDYDIEAERIAYSPTEGSQVTFRIQKRGSDILSVHIEGGGYADITAEHGARNFDTSTLGGTKATIDIVGKIQMYINIGSIHDLRRAIENANDNRYSERDFKRYLERANGLYTAVFCYANEGENYVRGTLSLEGFSDDGWNGERWEARPIITFKKDNSSYALDSYFTEDRFRSVTNSFWNLLDDFEDLGKSVGSGASWGSDDYFWATRFVLFTTVGGEKTVEVRSDQPWTVTFVPSWLKVSTMSGSGDGLITLTASSHTGDEPRIASIVVKSGTTKRNIYVLQRNTDGNHVVEDPAAEVEGCYAYSSSGNTDGFVSMARVSKDAVRLTCCYNKGNGTIATPIDFSITQTREGIIYLKAANAEGSYFVENDYSWTIHLWLTVNDGDKDVSFFLQKKVDANGSGTLDDPFNATAATALAEYVGRYSESNDVYIKGKVATIKENYDNAYGNATFTISDDGTDNNSFLIYRALYLGNQKYTNGDVLKTGDEVVICGKVTNYGGNTPETVTGKAYIYSLNGKVVAPFITIWENDGTHGEIGWDSYYRFGLEGTDPDNQCIATFPQTVWSRLKSGNFYLTLKGSIGTQIYLTSGWWSDVWTGGVIQPGNEWLADNGDGTYTLTVNLSDTPLSAVLDEQHLLFTGGGYTPQKLYYQE